MTFSQSRKSLLLCMALLAFPLVRTVAASEPFFLPGEGPKPAGRKWVLVENMSDDFDGSALDRSKWQDDPVANGWRWYGRAPGLFRAENVQLTDGKMCVTVSKLDAPVVRGGKTFTHQGAIVRSLHPGQPGWYFECRMKANVTVMSSTFWLISKPGHQPRLELDIQECVGRTTDKTEPWARNWDQIFHSNLIQHKRRSTPKKVQLQHHVPTETKNWERFYVYGAWWKSPAEVQFYLDGKYVYSIKPKVAWDVPAFIQMAVETYDWNPVPEDAGLVATGTWEQRTTQYDWVRTWQLSGEAVEHAESSPTEELSGVRRDDTLAINGFWAVNVVRAGRYSIRLSRFPDDAPEAMRATRALLRIGEHKLEKDLRGSESDVTFDLDLQKGHALLQSFLRSWSFGSLVSSGFSAICWRRARAVAIIPLN